MRSLAVREFTTACLVLLLDTMGLPIHVDFGPFTNPGNPEIRSLALANPVIVPTETLTAHVHIGRFASPAARGKRGPHDGLLFDKGASTCPCELDIAYSDIESYLKEDGGGADIFIAPLGIGVDLRVDIALQKTMDGENWSLEILLPNCQPGSVRMAQIPELFRSRARLKIRCVCPKSPTTPVRIWANEPRARHAKPAILIGT